MNKINYWFVIIGIFISINIFCYFYNKSYLHNLTKEEIQKRKKILTNYNSTILINIIIVICLSGLYLKFNHRFNYNFNLFEIICHLFILLFVNDTWFYWFHRIQHRSNTYLNKIHKIHHKVVKSLPMDYIYTHPIELMIAFIGVLIPLLFMKINYSSFVLAIIIRQLHEIEIHSSEKNSSMFYVLNSPEKHDIHHKPGNKGNYASMFPIWDFIMNTSL